MQCRNLKHQLYFNWKLSDEKIDDLVKVYDVPTETITSIFESELTPGMIRVRIEGHDDAYWVKACQLTATDQYWHPPFSGELKEKIIFIQRALAEVYLQTLEYWEDGFRHDLHAKQEIEIWFRVAMLYSNIADNHRLNREQKHEAFSVLSACLNGTKNTVLKNIKLCVLPHVLAEELIEDFFSYQ